MEKIERVDDHSLKVIVHTESVVSNQDAYNHFAQMKTKARSIEVQMGKMQMELDKLNVAIDFWKSTALDCEARLPKQTPSEGVNIEPSEVKK